MASLKPETGTDVFTFFLRLVLAYFGLSMGFAWLGLLGIEIPMAADPGLRLLEFVAFGAVGLAAMGFIGAILSSFLKIVLRAASGALANACAAGEACALKIGDLSARLLLGLLKLMVLPITWPFNRFRRGVIAPWLERLRQKRELRRLYAQVKDQYPSFEEFVRAFEHGTNPNDEAANGEREATPAPADKFAEACRILGLADNGSFTQAELKARYHQLMKEVHPDVIGPSALAAQINEARDLIKARKGWK